MIQFRRLVSVILGVWLGAGIAVDLAVTQNFAAVDRFLSNPGSVAAAVQLNQMGKDKIRPLLRRNAAEENNAIFENWERIEMALGTVLFLLLLFGERPQMSMLTMTGAMILIVVLQHFLLSSNIAELGRVVPDLPPESATVRRFWKYHGIYSGSELLKLAVGFAFAFRLVLGRKRDRDHFKNEFEAANLASTAGTVR